MTTSISWVMLFHKILKTSSVDISTAKQNFGLVARMQLRCCSKDGVAHKWREIIMAYLEKSFFELFWEREHCLSPLTKGRL